MWECFAGDCLPITLALLDSNEDPVDLTGYSFTMDVVPEGADTISPDLTIDEALGTIEASLTGDQTEELAKGKRTKVYLRITEPSATCVNSVLLGRVRVRS